MSDLLLSNLLSPVVLAFALGVTARAMGSALRLPKDLYTSLSVYLLFALGLKGGVELSEAELSAVAGPAIGSWAGLSVGGAAVLAAMAASASYIAAPPAVRATLPAANPTFYLTASLAITFPFNMSWESRCTTRWQSCCNDDQPARRNEDDHHTRILHSGF